MRTAADPAAQLMQLGDAEPVGVADHHHRRVRHVHADLDHRGGHQHVGLPGHEPGHHRVLLLGRQLAVQHLHPQRRPAARRAARRTDPPRRRPAAGIVARVAPDRRRRRRSGHRPRTPAGPGRPPRRSAARPARPRPGGGAASTTTVLTAARPAGISRRVEVSRSPNTVIATERGIGVAVITSTCGRTSALALSAARCSTPNRCCSSTTTRPRSANCTPAAEQGVGADHDAASPGGGPQRGLALLARPTSTR